MLLSVKYKKIFLFLFLAVTLFFGYQLKNLSFEHDLSKFFNKNENEYKFSQEFFQQFGGKGEGGSHQERIILLLNSNKNIDFNFIKNIDLIDKKIKKINTVIKTHNILNQPLFIFTSMGRFPYKIFHVDDSASFEQDIEVAKNYPDITGKYLSKDWQSSLIYIQLKPGSNIDTILQVKQTISELPELQNFNSYQFFNSTLTNHLVVKKLQNESIILTGIAIFLIILLLIYFTRSFVGVMIPLSIVLICVVWIIGSITLLGISLNVLTIAIPVIVGVISLSDVIHIISRYSEEDITQPLKVKMKRTQKDMLKAIILTSVTTSMGFLSLIPSQIQVFVEFGFFATLGVLYAFVLAYWLLPILLANSKSIKLHNNLGKITPKTLHPRATVTTFAIVLIACTIGLIMIKNDSYIYDDINAKDEASLAIRSMEKEFYGIRDLSLAIELKDTTKKLTDFEVIQQLDKLESKVDSIYQLNNYTSLTTLIKQMNRARNGGRAEYFSIPDSQRDIEKIWRTFENNHQFFTVNSLVSENKLNTFIYSKIHDLGSYKTALKNKQLNDYVKANFPNTFKVTITGGSHILDQTNFSVTKTMLLSLAFIMLAIISLISFIYKSIRIGLISIIPNALPLFIIIGVVGWFDLGLSVSTTIVFTIVFGIAVDDTIHFLSRYDIERKNKQSKRNAIINAINTSGGAISLTSIILIAGFGTLIFSDFHANYSTGLLVSIGLLTALLCDLFILPLFIYVFDKENNTSANV